MSVCSASCAICISPLLSHHQNAVSTPCGHLFHQDCLHKALISTKKKCPACRVHVSNSSVLRLYPDLSDETQTQNVVPPSPPRDLSYADSTTDPEELKAFIRSLNKDLLSTQRERDGAIGRAEQADERRSMVADELQVVQGDLTQQERVNAELHQTISRKETERNTSETRRHEVEGRLSQVYMREKKLKEDYKKLQSKLQRMQDIANISNNRELDEQDLRRMHQHHKPEELVVAQARSISHLNKEYRSLMKKVRWHFLSPSPPQ
ncbi:hypothetical protein CYMTET_20558, partial [Cymbomonas tetramitiformis]